MKVKELIAELGSMDPEADITVNTYAGCHGLDNVYKISGVEFWEANEKWKTPASAFIEVGDGCFCDGHRGTKIKKLGLGPQNISQYYLGLEDAAKEVDVVLKTYLGTLQELGNGKDYADHLTVLKYGQAKSALESVLNKLSKLQNRGDFLK